ncbi:MAG: hypothetical protein JWP83_6157 [Mycobacterium sp.]|jgi:hypothetical protein|nr:hypothetical protein [Mycobacterium sp.]
MMPWSELASRVEGLSPLLSSLTSDELILMPSLHAEYAKNISSISPWATRCTSQQPQPSIFDPALFLSSRPKGEGPSDATSSPPRDSKPDVTETGTDHSRISLEAGRLTGSPTLQLIAGHWR